MWVARDKNGELYLYEFKPSKREIDGTWYDWDNGDRYGIIRLSRGLFPNVIWDDKEALEVEVYERDLVNKHEELKDAYDVLHMTSLSQVSLYKSLYYEEKKKSQLPSHEEGELPQSH